MTLHARPHMNGNTVEDFKTAYYSLTVTEKTLKDCMSDLSRFMIHGRNYQHLDGTQAIEAESFDREEMKKLGEAILATQQLKRGIEKVVAQMEKKS